MAASKGRPPKLTQRISPDSEQTYGDRIIEALQTGAFLEHACGYANISRAAAYEWLSKGKDARAQLEEHEGDRSKLSANQIAYMDFADAVERARSTAIVANLGIIRKAAHDGTWTAAAWYLERTLPQHFGRQQRIEIDQPSLSNEAAREKLAKLDLGIDDDELE